MLHHTLVLPMNVANDAVLFLLVSTLRPDSVKCYLVDDEDLNNQPKPTNFPNPKISPSPKSTDEYVEMCRKKMLAGERR